MAGRVILQGNTFENSPVHINGLRSKIVEPDCQPGHVGENTDWL